MKMKFKTYPKYKDYGIEWIGEIPEDWEVKKLKFTSDVYISNVDKKIDSNEEVVFLCNYIDVYKNEFITSNLEFMQSTASFEQIKKLALSKDDVIITKDSETIEEIAIPALVVEDLENIVCGYHLSLIRTHKEKLLGRYLFRLFQNKQFSKQFSINANGVTRFGISTYPIKNILILLPPWQEQKSIAEYLNKEILKINTLIEKDKRLIELLKEKRISLINHAVTKGLNPNVKMKDSGIKWIGEIPKEWEVNKVKHKYLVIDGDRGKEYPSEDDLKDSGIPFLSAGCIDDFKLFIDKSNYISEEKFHKLGRGKLKNKDIILTVRGTIGKAAVFLVSSYNTGFINAEMMILRKYDNLEYDYLFYIIFCDVWQKQVDYYSYGTAQKQLNNFILKNILIPIPSLNEQNKIVQSLDKSTTKINKTIKLIEQKIALLEEYKKSIIHHVVTGKIDVREVI